MSHGVVFVEERSAEIVTREIARMLHVEHRLTILSFEGKSDLMRSISRKVGHWRAAVEPRFVITRDNDGGNCKDLKNEMLALVPASRLAQVRVRIIMQELESWYLGDPDALRLSGLVNENAVRRLVGQPRYRTPEKLTNAAQIVEGLTERAGKTRIAREIGPYLLPSRNRAPSLKAFADAIIWAAEDR